MLEAHTWPGNVRELKNVIERAVILSRGKRLRLDLVLPSEAQVHAARPETEKGEILTEEEFRALEKANLTAALEATDWQISGSNGAAELLGLKASTLAYRMKQFGIRRKVQDG